MTPDGEPATVIGGRGLQLSINNVVQNLGVVHSFGSTLNSNGILHAPSGRNPDGVGLIVGFEDLIGGADRDFEDAVFQVEPLAS